MMNQSWRRRHRFYRHLFAATLFLFAMMALPMPIFRIHLVGGILVQLLLLIELGQPIFAITDGRLSRSARDVLVARVYRLVGAISLLATICWIFTPASSFVTGLPLLMVLTFFVFWSLKRLLRLLAREDVIGQEVIWAAVAGYLLLGLSGGLLFTVLETIHPGSFENLVDVGRHSHAHVLMAPDLSQLVWDLDFSRINYFAFVSLTTVGYGDIVPVTPLAEMASVWLAISGSLYLALVMGLLISRFTVQTQQEEELGDQQNNSPPPR